MSPLAGKPALSGGASRSAARRSSSDGLPNTSRGPDTSVSRDRSPRSRTSSGCTSRPSTRTVGNPESDARPLRPTSRRWSPQAPRLCPRAQPLQDARDGRLQAGHVAECSTSTSTPPLHPILPSPFIVPSKIPSDAPCERAHLYGSRQRRPGAAEGSRSRWNGCCTCLDGERREIGIRDEVPVSVGTAEQVLEEAEVVASGVEQQRRWVPDQGARGRTPGRAYRAGEGPADA